MTFEPGDDLLPAAAAYELPTGREVVGRGLQLAYDASAELRRASLYVGLLLFALAGPALIVLIADLPRLRDFPFEDLVGFDQQLGTEFISIFGSLSILATIALLGFVTISIDGTIMAVTILAGQALGRPVTLRQALIRARQVFWRYGAATFVVGIIGQLAATIVSELTGGAQSAVSTGASLLAVFVSTIVTAPFGYVAAGIVLGDVDAATALRRSIRLARARPRLAAVVAAFAFLAGVLELFGIGAAVDAAARVIEFQHLSIDPASGDVLVALPLIAAGLIALGSLGLTVAAVVAAPQVVAFLGLTQFSAGLDRTRSPIPVVVPPTALGEVPDPEAPEAPEAPEPPASAWVRGAEPREARFRWVTIPMLFLIAFAVFIAISGLVAAS
ncbi:MAG: hypothetical protein ACAH65_02815 [Chloroflexota bacterium]